MLLSGQQLSWVARSRGHAKDSPPREGKIARHKAGGRPELVFPTQPRTRTRTCGLVAPGIVVDAWVSTTQVQPPSNHLVEALTLAARFATRTESMHDMLPGPRSCSPGLSRATVVLAQPAPGGIYARSPIRCGAPTSGGGEAVMALCKISAKRNRR
jgi:hypothetical protein